MTRNRRLRHWWPLVVVGVVAAIVYCSHPLAPLPAPSGDGEFTDLSWRVRAFGIVPVLDVRGFAVSMPRFDLGKDHTASYRVSRLPDIGQECKVFLAIDDPQGRWFARDEEIRKLRGFLTIEVIDGRGELIRHAEGPLSAYTWGYWRDAEHLYRSDALPFQARPGEEYTMRVVYQADPALAGFQGYCSLECGARK